MANVLVMAVLATMLACSITAKDLRRPNNFNARQGLVDWYDCSGKLDRNYIHPFDCTKFISCVDQAYAYEMNCAINQDGDRLHYHHTINKCEEPEIAGCVTDRLPTTTTASTTSITPTTTVSSTTTPPPTTPSTSTSPTTAPPSTTSSASTHAPTDGPPEQTTEVDYLTTVAP